MTHPAFAYVCDDDELARIAAHTRQALERLRKLPPFALRLLTRRSVIARDMQRTRGGVVSEMTTYLLKLGPENLPVGIGSRPDRKMLAGLGPAACRLRLRETASRIADGVAAVLAKRSDPLILVNLAGGVAADSLNACILLQARHPTLLAGRRVDILVCDIDREGPAFARAFAKVLGHPSFVRVPGWLLRLLMGEVADAVLEGDADLRPTKLTRSGFQFLCPDITTALRHELGVESR